MLVLALLLTFLQNNAKVAFCDKTPITCNAGAFSAGAPASVVCNFQRDVSIDQLAVIVEHFPKGATADAVGTEMLACQRNDPVKKYECSWKDGLKFDGVIKDHLTLQIPSLSKNFTGMYMCFTEPAEDTAPQLCELSLKVAPNVTRITTPSTGKSSLSYEGGTRQVLSIMVPIIVVLVVSIIVVIAVIYARRQGRFNCWKKQSLNQESALPLMRGHVRQCEPEDIIRNKKIETFIKDLKLNESAYEEVTKLMAQEIGAGNVKEYHVPVKSLPDGTEDGACLVVELYSTTVKLYRVLLQGFHTDTAPHARFVIPTETRHGTGLELFIFIANCLKTFLRDHDLSRKKFHVGFIFSFPCAQDDGLTKATLIEWTRGFACSDVVGQDVAECLQQALNDTFTPCNLDVRMVCNDATGALIAVACEDTSCKIAVTLKNGFKASYTEDGIKRPMVLTNIEIGMLGEFSESSYLSRFTSDYDREVDECSMHPGKHILEKMVCLRYIGEVVRFALRTLIKENLLFGTAQNKLDILREEGAFTADFVSLVENDSSENYLATKHVLKELDVEDYTEEDCRVVVHVCQVVLKRAAFLAAAGLAALINRVNQCEVKIAVEGDPLRYHPKYCELVNTKTKQLVKPGLKFTLHPMYYGSVIGTALMTATLTSRTRPSAGV